MTIFLTVIGAAALIVFSVLAIMWVIEGVALAHVTVKALVDGDYLVWCKRLKKLVPKSLLENDIIAGLDDEVDNLVKRVTALEAKLERKEE